jgi:hypothetical protein
MVTQNYSDPAGQGDHESRAALKFQVITHVSPPDGGTELTARLSWPDEGSARSFATVSWHRTHPTPRPPSMIRRLLRRPTQRLKR